MKYLLYTECSKMFSQSPMPPQPFQWKRQPTWVVTPTDSVLNLDLKIGCERYAFDWAEEHERCSWAGGKHCQRTHSSPAHCSCDTVGITMKVARISVHPAFFLYQSDCCVKDVQENGWVVRKQICPVCPVPVRKPVGRFLHYLFEINVSCHKGYAVFQWATLEMDPLLCTDLTDSFNCKPVQSMSSNPVTLLSFFF